MSARTWTTATLLEGRIEVGNRIHVKTKDGEFRGVINETEHRGKDHPRAIVNAKDGMHAVEFENVAPGARQKSPERKGGSK